jgi:hypothetical protein
MSTQTIDLSPQILNLVLYAGDGVKIRLTVVDNDDAAIDLTGEIESQIRITRDKTDPANATFSVDLTDQTDGIVVLSLTGDDTQGLVTDGKKFKGFWDVQWTPTGEQPRTILQGKVECFEDVSR